MKEGKRLMAQGGVEQLKAPANQCVVNVDLRQSTTVNSAQRRTLCAENEDTLSEYANQSKWEWYRERRERREQNQPKTMLSLELLDKAAQTTG